jgi:hypothetical protein
VTGDEPWRLMPIGLANTPDAKPATKTATARPATIFSECDILAFMALLDQHVWAGRLGSEVILTA